MKEVVIKIPDLVYESIIVGAETSRDEADVLFAIRQGTVLPKGHGDLIDKDQIQQIELWNEFMHLIYRNKSNPLLPVKYTLEAPTIVPAYRENKE